MQNPPLTQFNEICKVPPIIPNIIIDNRLIEIGKSVF